MNTHRTCFIFYPTWKCNLKCSYCQWSLKDKIGDQYSLVYEKTKEIEIRENNMFAFLLHCLNRFRPYHLEFTGGEPTVWSDLKSFTDHLPRDATWAITSNTLKTDVIEKLSPYTGCAFWTASYHFDHDELFIHNVNQLRKRGFSVGVTIVATPENYENAMEKSLIIQERSRVEIAIHPECRPEAWEGHEQKRKDLDSFAKKTKDVRIVDTTPVTQGERTAPVDCSGGYNYFHLFPDGSLYRCLTKSFIHDEPALGSIANYVPPETMQPCLTTCQFPCDVDARKGRWNNDQ